MRQSLSERIFDYIDEAISGDEFDGIDYYSLGRKEIADAVAVKLRDLLRTAPLGVVAELYQRAEEESAQKPTLLGVVSRWTVVFLLGVLMLLGVGILSVLHGGINVVTVLLFALVAIAGGYAIRRGRIIRRQFENAQRSSASAWRLYRHAVTKQMVSPVIREVINDRLYHYDSQLTVRSSPGLMTEDPLFWIATDNSRRLLNLMAVMPDGGSIGLAGPRGCGKTTLLDALCTSELPLPRGVAEAVLVTAPIEFSSRDFLLYLFARICQQTLRRAPLGKSPLPAAHPDTLRGGRSAGRGRRHLGTVTLLGALCLIASPFVAYEALPAARQVAVVRWLLAGPFKQDPPSVFADTPRVWDFVHSLNTPVAAVSAILFLVGFCSLLAAAARGLASFLQYLTGLQQRDTGIHLLARRHLRNIRFQQSYSYGWSGSLTVPIAQVGINEAFSLAEYQQSLPEIVAAMREFLELIANKSSPVIIAVDELDKVASDVTAAQFLNDLKGIFGVRHCYYLVSVSEEALSNFELRGFPFRDAFDSAFDEILHLRPLTYPESRRLLQRRVVGLSAGYLCLCQCLAGGLPRDLVRVARDLVEIGRRTDAATRGKTAMCEVVAELVQLDIQGRAEATMIALRRTSGKLEIEPMALWINRISGCLAGWLIAKDGNSTLPAGELRVRELLDLCDSYPPASYDVKPIATEVGRVEGTAAMINRLGLGLIGSLYYLATVIELFRDDRTKAEFGELDGSIAGTAKTRQIEYLTRARQAFALSPMIAWKEISEFRESWHMSVLDFPGR